MTLFTLENVKAGYGDHVVLDDVSLRITPGEFTGIIGPNGAGKSTLLKLLCRHLVPMAGTLQFRGQDVKTIPSHLYAPEVAIVHQKLENLLPFTVEKFVSMGRFPHQRFWQSGKAHHGRIVNHAISVMDLEHLRAKPITELSGGEQQRTFIARAVAQTDQVILLDEPVAHLDINHVTRVMDLLAELNAAGTTIITVLHDINLAADYCSRILAIKNGTIFTDGPPSEVITYQAIESLFDTVCVVHDNPITGKPYTYPVPGRYRKNS